MKIKLQDVLNAGYVGKKILYNGEVRTIKTVELDVSYAGGCSCCEPGLIRDLDFEFEPDGFKTIEIYDDLEVLDED